MVSYQSCVFRLTVRVEVDVGVRVEVRFRVRVRVRRFVVTVRHTGVLCVRQRCGRRR